MSPYHEPGPPLDICHWCQVPIIEHQLVAVETPEKGSTLPMLDVYYCPAAPRLSSGRVAIPREPK